MSMIRTTSSVSLGPIKIFSANANKEMAKGAAAHLGLDIGKSDASKFADGETRIVVDETVRGEDVFIIQSTSPPANDNLMELLILLDAMRRSSAGRITAVIPYYGYARQDRRARSHDPITAKLVADMIVAAGANRILTMDLHCPQIQGFFNIPLDHLKGIYPFAKHFMSKEVLGGKLDEVVVVSPDLGSVARCQAFADILHVPLAIVDKRRHTDKRVEFAHFIGDVKDKHAILLDDVLATGGSLCNAAKTVMDYGAKAVYACVTHPVLCGDAVENIKASPLEELVVLDTIEIPQEKRISQLKVLSVARYIGEAINCIHNNQSLGDLFNTMNDEIK